MGCECLIKVPPGVGAEACIDEFVKSSLVNPFKTYLLLPTSRLSEDIRRKTALKGVAVITDNVTTPEEFAAGIVDKYGGGTALISDEEAKLVLSGIIRKDRDALKILSRTGEYSARMLNDLYSLFGEFDGRMRGSVSDGMPDSPRIYTFPDKRRNFTCNSLRLKLKRGKTPVNCPESGSLNRISAEEISIRYFYTRIYAINISGIKIPAIGISVTGISGNFLRERKPFALIIKDIPVVIIRQIIP